ncbi:adhesin major subunit pilin [Pseudomonas fluorescens]|uniref:Adhesin major subunit pilin n=2 Tax=Pseudomonas fluorescens TaxID=294 RepID=A0A448E0Q4_PSEFL|nr:adhesin major subunit pilin [Pseudomonas fluorescens]
MRSQISEWFHEFLQMAGGCMSRQRMIAIGAGAVLWASSSAYAAREIREFEVSASIPTEQFYVTPAEPDWIHREQVLPWDTHTASLGTLRRNFDVLNDSGAILARLEQLPVLINPSQTHAIYLRVLFNGHELNTNSPALEVVPAEIAMAGARVPLDIEVRTPPTGYVPGDYYGNVLLMFTAAAP